MSQAMIFISSSRLTDGDELIVAPQRCRLFGHFLLSRLLLVSSLSSTYFHFSFEVTNTQMWNQLYWRKFDDSAIEREYCYFVAVLFGAENLLQTDDYN